MNYELDMLLEDILTNIVTHTSKFLFFLYTSTVFEDEMYTVMADGNSSTSCLAKALLPSIKCEKLMAMFNGR